MFSLSNGHLESNISLRNIQQLNVCFHHMLHEKIKYGFTLFNCFFFKNFICRHFKSYMKSYFLFFPEYD